MNPIVGWIIGILAVVLLGTIIDLLMSEHKMGKYIRSIFAAVTILVIILPIPSIMQNGINFDNSFIIQNEWELDENFLTFATRVRLNALARGVEAQLASGGISGTEIRLEGSMQNQEVIVYSARVNMQNASITTNITNIDKHSHVQGLVAGYLFIDRGLVTVYGEPQGQ